MFYAKRRNPSRSLSSDWPIEGNYLMMGMLVYHLFYLSISTHGCRAFGTRTQFYPKGMGASIRPFGRDRYKSALAPN